MKKILLFTVLSFFIFAFLQCKKIKIPENPGFSVVEVLASPIDWGLCAVSGEPSRSILVDITVYRVTSLDVNGPTLETFFSSSLTTSNSGNSYIRFDKIRIPSEGPFAIDIEFTQDCSNCCKGRLGGNCDYEKKGIVRWMGRRIFGNYATGTIDIPLERRPCLCLSSC